MKSGDQKKHPRRTAPMTSEWVPKSHRRSGVSTGASARKLLQRAQALRGRFITHLPRRWSDIKQFPRLHLALAGLLVPALAIMVALPKESDSTNREIRQTLVIEASETTVFRTQVTPEAPAVVQESLAPIAEEEVAPAPADDVASAPAVELTQLTEVKQTVRSGDSLSTVFRRAGLNDRAMLEVVNSSAEGKKLSRLHPGHQFIFHLDEDKQLQALVHVLGPLNQNVFQRGEAGFEHKTHVREPEVELVVRNGTIRSSLYNAGISAGLSDSLIMQMAAIFGWDVDFALDIRGGDRFQVLFEQTYIDGEQIGTGRILAAEFVNRGTSFKAVRYVNSEGEAQYFTPTGNAMRKAFLRAPLDFRRISSNFNPRRLHPITNTVRPHRGIDYAADRGTPVWAAGDGRVIASAYNNANGNYVVIQHGNNIQTKYLHLDRRDVRNGQRVRQKQVIGTVGSTGMSTAPHLHYEFLIDGVHRNPRTIVQQLPKAESISKEELPRFHAQTQPLLAQLESGTRMAANTDSDDQNPRL